MVYNIFESYVVKGEKMYFNESMVEGFYSRYISRDLANLLGGGLFIVIIWFSFRNQLHDISWYDFLPPILWEQPLRLISFLAVAYCVGFFFDREGDKLAPKIVPLYCKIIGFTRKTPTPDPFEILKKIEFPNYKSILVLRQDLIVKGKYDNRILDQLERYVTLWIFGKSVGLSAIFGSIIMLISLFLIKDSNLLQIVCIMVIPLFLFGLHILKQGSEAWKQYHQELSHLSINMN